MFCITIHNDCGAPGRDADMAGAPDSKMEKGAPPGRLAAPAAALARRPGRGRGNRRGIDGDVLPDEPVDQVRGRGRGRGGLGEGGRRGRGRGPPKAAARAPKAPGRGGQAAPAPKAPAPKAPAPKAPGPKAPVPAPKRRRLGSVPEDAKEKLGCSKCPTNPLGCSECRKKIGLKLQEDGSWTW